MTSPHSTPYHKVVHGPDTIGDYPIVDLGDIGDDPTASPAPGVDPPSDAPIGALGSTIDAIAAIGESPSGVRLDLSLPADDDLPPTSAGM